jgi:hypothetical protein
MFVQGKVAVATFALVDYPRVVEALYHSGYRRHKGFRWTREHEIDVWKKSLPHHMQVHVQVILSTLNRAELYAHAEPEGYGFRHIWAAITDKADFDEGRRIVLDDLGTAILSRQGALR